MPFPVDLQSLRWEIGDSLWGFPWMTLQFFFFFLTAFKILSLTFAVLTMLGLGVDLFHFVWDFLCFWFWICVSYYRLNFQPWFHQIHFCLFLSPLLLGPLKFEFYYAWCYLQFSSVQSLSRVQLFATPWIAALQASLSSVQSLSCVRLCDPVDCNTPSFPVHHQLLEFTQTHVHRVGDAIQPSHPLSSPSPPAPNPSQHQSLFQWVSSSPEVAKVLEFQL